MSRRTQAERRNETQSLVLQSARRLFGENGYSNTSVDEIAADCGLTTRPIYHYFGNKQALFTATVEATSARIDIDFGTGTEASEQPTRTILQHWRHFLDLCDDPHFRQIVLIDAPNILGRERWAVSPQVIRVQQRMQQKAGDSKEEQFRLALLGRMVIAALTEAALMIADSDDIQLAKQQSEHLVQQLLGQIDL